MENFKETQPHMSYSLAFQELISDESKFRELTEGSHVFTTPWNKDDALKGWEDGRRFISQAIDRDGTLLDYGCANGFLLRSLQEWSSHKLDVYGVDIDKNSIEKAKDLFPEISDHFTTGEDFASYPEYPKEFDTIFWNVWDNHDFSKDEVEENLLKSLLRMTKKSGRLVLGFYNTREKNKETIKQLGTLRYTLSGILENPNGDEMLAWFDKNE